ncbi:Alkaline phosphatase synthesis transcriptional regulatory protein PhoP [bacterium HR17]|jgi:DNA-binding response OmpR family regulator|uniref:Alkaline phosphatase synthesis transcriptional regulatory protein PhoP n=1 Tax=Candidatus Fervidibacter japonicus TaxID=2035412 RepID=A0A2H5XBC2_9BACT|nr:Alkaline phosphatase synthesis transcriptional regulatory protein PhoP [bacterium HR17]
MADYILVVDDEEAVRSVIAESLRRDGFEVREACDGQDALEQVVADPPSLIVMDVLMPHLDGFSLCRTIRQMPEPFNRVPIIMVTALDTHLGQQMGREVGADLYLTKPFSPRELRQRVRELLATRQTCERSAD